MKKIQFILVTIILISLFACGKKAAAFPLTVISQGEKKLFKQIATQDSGYLQKKEALLILSIAGILDSTNIEYKQYINKSDTIAKYYKRTNNGNCIFCIEYTVDLGCYPSHVLIECSPKGKILEKEVFFNGPNCSVSYNDFYKFGDFFALENCSSGFPSSDGYLYLFKGFPSKDSLNIIPLWCLDIFDEEEDEEGYITNVTWIHCYSTMKLENDSLTVIYISEKGTHVSVENGKEDETEYKIIEKSEPIDVLYIYKNRQWHIADKKQLKKWNHCFEMNVYF